MEQANYPIQTRMENESFNQLEDKFGTNDFPMTENQFLYLNDSKSPGINRSDIPPNVPQENTISLPDSIDRILDWHHNDINELHWEDMEPANKYYEESNGWLVNSKISDNDLMKVRILENANSDCVEKIQKLDEVSEIEFRKSKCNKIINMGKTLKKRKRKQEEKILIFLTGTICLLYRLVYYYML